MSHSFDITYGGIYEVRVSTNVPNAVRTPSVVYNAPPILPPFQVEVFPTVNGSYVISWQERTVLSDIGPYVYEVLVSSGSKLNETTAKRFEVTNPPFIFTNATEEIYTFAVQLKSKAGYKSRLSEITSSTNKLMAEPNTITEANFVAIFVPIIVLLFVLGTALAIFYVRNRRLQNSFTRFANSHYDTRSEAATFDDSILEEDDSPQIQGFSQDEPLVIA